MDVEKLQRINNLARELMKHGMAGSMDEAVRMAEQKIQGNPEVSNIKETMSDTMVAQSQVSSNPDNKLELQKIKAQLDDQARMLHAIGVKINELVSEYNILKETVNRVKTIKVPEESKEETQTQFREIPDEKKDPHARTGEYKPDDVAIEKIFYSGTR